MTLTILNILVLWFALIIIFAPLIGRALRRNRRAYPKYPLPSGSLRDRA